MGNKIPLKSNPLLGSAKTVAFIDTQKDKFVHPFMPIFFANQKKLVRPEEQKTTGYIPNQNLQYVETVQIPANFAGMEAVEVPTRLCYQYFVIDTVEQTEDGIRVTANHIWYELRSTYTNWQGSENTTYSGAAVCANIMNNAMSGSTEYLVASDCTDTLSGKEFDYRHKNLCEAFLDPEKGVCAKFGLSMIRDNWTFYCIKAVGYDRGFVIEDKKNLLGVTRTEDITDTVTRIIPFARESNGNPHYMAVTNYVDSSHVSDYLYPRVSLLDTGMVIGKDGVTAQNVDAKLLAAAQREYTENHVDEPKLEMDISFISLGDTEEYQQYRGLDKVYLYDILTIKDATRGYNYSAQVVGIEHDVLTGQLLSVKIGSITNSDGVRKIATWQVPSVDGSNIRLQSISVGALADGSVTGENLQDNIISAGKIIAGEVTTEALHAGAVTADKIGAGEVTTEALHAGAVTADKIGAGEVTAAKLAADVFTAVDAEISSANIGYAQIKDASVQNLITKDAIADRYYIEKLQVQNLQVLHQTVDNLVVKAANGNYYSLDISDAGVVTPTQVTVTTSEINAGVTSSGRSIIETDLLVTDLAASNIKGANALIDKITAARLDVDELFARQATIAQLQTVDISSNTSLQVQAQNQIDLTVGKLQINGTNIICNGDEIATNTDYLVKEWYLLEEMQVGQTYTFTVCVTPAASVPYYRLFTSGSTGNVGRLTPTGTAKQILTLTWQFTGYAGTTPPHFTLRLYRNENVTVTDNTTIHWAKLEKGTQVSDSFVPSPNRGENLIYGGDTQSTMTTGSRSFGIFQTDDMVAGETYTYTACIKPGSDYASFTLNTCTGGPSIALGDRMYFTDAKEKQVVSTTFVFPGYINDDHRIFGYRAPATVTTTGTVYWAKLYKGVNREAWSPNPNEINGSTIKVTQDSIDIATGGTLNMSGGSINIETGGKLNIAGGIEGSLIIPNGTVNALNGNFTNLSIGGQKIGAGSFLMPVLCKFTQGASSAPSGHGFLWFNASGTSYSTASRSGTTDVGYLPRTYTLQAPSNTLTSGTFSYTLTFGVVNRQNSNPSSITFKVTATISGVTFTSSDITLAKWQTQAVSITVSSTTNLFSSTSTLSVAFSSNWSGSTGLGPDLDGSGMTLTAQKSGTSGTQDVTVKYVP